MNTKQQKPLEYWIGKSTDAYLDNSERQKCLEMLANKINSEVDAATICVDLLAHKVVSPDQDEALITIKTVDYLMRNCGEKVHVKVGKYRFLNQLVKLLTPKYLGAHTSNEVKTLVIRLMFTWQKSIKHITKYKEVYDTLKSNRLITEDPKIPEDEIAVVAAPPARCAVFEDEEKSKLLKNLLASNKPEHLEMANKLIKSLVESFEQCDNQEENKMAKVHERRKTLDTALYTCKMIEQYKIDKTAQILGLGEYSADTEELLQRSYDELSNLQTTLYSYVNELAETNDPCVEEVLNINDQINKLLPKFPEDSKRNRMSKTEKSLLNMENQELLVLNSPTEEEPEESSSYDQNLEGSLLNNMVETEFAEDVHDVPFIGFDKHMTPVLPRRSGRKAMSPPKPSQSIFETDYLADQRIPEAPKPPTLNELKSKEILTLHSLDTLMSSTTPEQPVTPCVVSFPEEVLLNPSAVVFKLRQPLVILDNEGIRVLLYWCVTDESADKMRNFVISIQNCCPEKIQDVNLTCNTSDKNIMVRLQSLKKDLPGFSPFGVQESLNLLLCVLPLTDVKQADIDFSLNYIQILERSISGNFLLSLE